MSKINVLGIVIDHLKTLKDHSTGDYELFDFVLFFGVPAIVTVLLLVSYGSLAERLITVIATSLSIFAALLFNLLLLVYDAARRTEGDLKSLDDTRRQFLRQLADNISFAVLVAVAAVVAVIILMFVFLGHTAALIVSGFIYFLITLFTLTLLMILKRIHTLLNM